MADFLSYIKGVIVSEDGSRQRRRLRRAGSPAGERCVLQARLPFQIMAVKKHVQAAVDLVVSIAAAFDNFVLITPQAHTVDLLLGRYFDDTFWVSH